MKYLFPKGSTSVIVPVFIQDSSSTTGAGLGSLDQTSSIVGGYMRPGGTGVALAVDENVTTEGTYQAPSVVGKVRIGTPANMRTGIYELHLHNDLLAAGADAVLIALGGATNMADLIIEIQLAGIDVNDGVRAGMTALPNAAADANNGLVTGDGSVTLTAGVGNRPSVDATAVSGDTTAADNLESACDNYSATRGLAGTALPAAAADAAGGVPISDAGGLDMDALNTAAVRLTAARAQVLDDWVNAGRLDAILDTIAADVVNIDGAAMRGTDSAATAANLATVDTVVDAIKAVTDLLPDAGALSTIGTDTARLTAVRAAVLTDWIDGGRLDLLLDAVKTVTDALPDAGALNDLATIAGDVVNIDGAAMRGTDSAALASVCTEARLSELDAGTGGKMANQVDVIAVDVAGLDGDAMVGTNSAALASVCTEARLAELAAANLPADVDAILADTNELQADNVPGLIAALNDLSAANVNAEVADVLKTDTVAEQSQGAPPAAPTMEQIFSYLYMFFRNKVTQTATLQTLLADDGSTAVCKATVSDDATTATKAEFISGA